MLRGAGGVVAVTVNGIVPTAAVLIGRAVGDSAVARDDVLGLRSVYAASTVAFFA